MAIRTNMSVQSLSEMQFVLSQCGSNIETFEQALHKISEGLMKAPDKFRALGLSVAQLKELDAENRFLRIADAIRSIELPAQQSAAVIDLFGESGSKLLPLINAGVQGVDQLRLMANELKLVMNKEDTDKAAALSDAYDRFSRSVQSVSVSLGSIFAPIMTDMANRWAVNLNSVKNIIQQYQTVITIFSGVVSTLGYGTAAVYGLGLSIKAVSIAFSYVSSIIHTFGKTLYFVGSTINQVTVAVGLYSSTLTQAASAEQLLTKLGIVRRGIINTNCAAILLMSQSELAATVNAKLHAIANSFLNGSESSLLKLRILALATTKKTMTCEIACSAAKKVSIALNWTLIALQKSLNFVLGKSIANIAIMTGSLLARNIAMAVSNTLTFVATMATKGLCAAVLGLNIALFACPASWIAGGLLALGAVVVGVIGYFYSGVSAATQYAKAMAEVKNKNDLVRQTHQHTLEKLEKLSAKEALSAREKEDVKQSVAQLNAAYHGLNLTIDESTGNLKNADKAVQNIKKSMDSAAQNDLANTIKAINAETRELKSKLNNRGGTGYWRSVGTYLTFGYVDNSEEIKAKIEDNKKKVLEFSSQKIKLEIESVVEFSDDFADAEKKLAEFAEKDRRDGLSDTEKKVDDLHKEFEQRRKILDITIQEAEEYAKTGALSKAQLETLAKRKALLANLTNLETEQKNKIAQVAGDDAQKRYDELNRNQWEETASDQEKKIAAIHNEYQERKKLLQIMIQSAEAQSTLTAEQTENLEKHRQALSNIEKLESERVQDLKDQAQSVNDTNVRDEIDKIHNEKENKQRQRANAQEDKTWEKMAQDNERGAEKIAAWSLSSAKGVLDTNYKTLESLIKNGASQEEINQQKEIVAQNEQDIDKWQGRFDELQTQKLSDKQAAEIVSNPSIMLAGSLDAQRQFLENQNANKKNPLEDKADRQLDVQGKILTAVLDFTGGLFGV